MTDNGFDTSFFEFFVNLTHNNDRGWFQEHKQDYERAVVLPMQAFIMAMAPMLEALSPHFVADPRKNGGSMFRIYRDTRFAKDKTPYKTHAAVNFRHVAGKDVHAPGFYMHASLEGLMVGMGIWHPPTPALAEIRQALDEDPKGWLAARDHPAFRESFKLEGESLKRPPKGYSADHPLLEDLKRKDFCGMRKFDSQRLIEPGLAEEVAASFERGLPLMKFLCKALDVPF